MTRRHPAATILLWLLVTTGCATTNLESFREPDMAGRSFHKVLVMAPMADLSMRTETEQAFVERITHGGTQAVPSASILIADRKYNEEQLAHMLVNYNIDGVLMITLLGQYTQKIDNPDYTTCSSALASTSAALMNSQECSIGYYALRPTLEFKLRLYDVASNKTAWEGRSLTQGVTLTRYETLIGSVADSIVEDLRGAGFVQ